MPYTVNNAGVTWLTGYDVSFYREAQRETDTTFLMEILRLSLRQGGPLHNIALLAQVVCDQARATVAGTPIIGAPVSAGGASIWASYDPTNAAAREFCLNVKLLAKLSIMDGTSLINPLAFGDFGRAFADLIHAEPANARLQDISTLLKCLQNDEAFDKTTNRVRVNRYDVLNQMPGVGGTRFYLPPEDVLGTVDRLVGYYETADISGTTTDTLGVIGVLTSVNTRAIGTLNEIKIAIADAANDGLAFNAFAGMVVQQHHSMPEAMMALNLMPRDLGIGPMGMIRQVYSPFLTNSGFGDLANLNGSDVYSAWQKARYTTLGGTLRQATQMRMLVLIQDVYQMPNKVKEENELAVIVPFNFAAGDSTDPTYYGIDFYNMIVDRLNQPVPGPAVTLETISQQATAAWFGNDDPFNPVFANNAQRDRVVACVTDGMDLQNNPLVGAMNYADIVAPFNGAYAEIQDAEFHNLN